MLGYSRDKIRQHLEAALSGITTIDGRLVYGDAEPSVGLPSLTYVLEREDRDGKSACMVSDDSTGNRDVRITIEARASIRSGSDSPVDDLCLEVEKEIATATTLNQWCKGMRLESTELELGEGLLPVGLATMSYYGRYQEAVACALSNVEYDEGSTVFNVTFNTNVKGKATVEAQAVVGGEVFYSNQETVATKSHALQVSGLTPSLVYLIFYNFEADAYGIDVGGYTEYLMDGDTAPVVFTLAGGVPDPPPPA